MSVKKSPEELKSIFEKYAAKEGDPDQLSKAELKLLIEAEFPTLLKVSIPCCRVGASEGQEGGREERGVERTQERRRKAGLIRGSSGPSRAESTAAKANKARAPLDSGHFNMCFPSWWQAMSQMACT